MARVYHRDQAGAPVLVVSSTSNTVAHFTAFKTVLKACLITGFGSQPAAGWALVGEGANYIVLRNATESGYVCFTWATGIVTIWLASTYEGISSDAIVGVGKKSGVAANNATPHKFNFYNRVYADSLYSWAVVADEKTFIINWPSAYSSTSDGLGAAAGSFVIGAMYIGEDSEGNFIAVGGQNTTLASANANNPVCYFGAEGFTALKNPSTGLLVDAGSLSVFVPGLFAMSTTNPQPTPPAQAIASIAPAYWYGGGVQGGQFRGVCLLPQLCGVTFRSRIATSLGAAVTPEVRQGNAPIDLGDGNTYLLGMAHYLYVPFLFTDNLDFW